MREPAFCGHESCAVHFRKYSQAAVSDLKRCRSRSCLSRTRRQARSCPAFGGTTCCRLVARGPGSPGRRAPGSPDWHAAVQGSSRVPNRCCSPTCSWAAVMFSRYGDRSLLSMQLICLVHDQRMVPEELADIEARLEAIREVAGEPWRGCRPSPRHAHRLPGPRTSRHRPIDQRGSSSGPLALRPCSERTATRSLDISRRETPAHRARDDVAERAVSRQAGSHPAPLRRRRPTRPRHPR